MATWKPPAALWARAFAIMAASSPPPEPARRRWPWPNWRCGRPTPWKPSPAEAVRPALVKCDLNRYDMLRLCDEDRIVSGGFNDLAGLVEKIAADEEPRLIEIRR